MRRSFTVGLALALAVTALSASAQAEPKAKQRYHRVAYKTLEGSDRAFSRDEVRLSVRAAAGRILGRSSIPHALSVAACESGFNEHAIGGGRYVGVFQHIRSSWHARVGIYTSARGPLGVKPGASWHNARAQAIVSMRMVRSLGWGPWACA